MNFYYRSFQTYKMGSPEISYEISLELICELFIYMGGYINESISETNKNEFLKFLDKLAVCDVFEKLSPRVRFLLTDVATLRVNNWQIKKKEFQTRMMKKILIKPDRFLNDISLNPGSNEKNMKFKGNNKMLDECIELSINLETLEEIMRNSKNTRGISSLSKFQNLFLIKFVKKPTLIH